MIHVLPRFNDKGPWVTRDSDEFFECLQWCHAHCHGKFYPHSWSRWSFEDERDALLFRLAWA